MFQHILKPVEEKLILSIKDILKDACDGFTPFEVELTKLNYFKRYGKPSVIYSEVLADGQLSQLADKLENKLLEIGIRQRKNRYKAHLTIGRIKSIKENALVNLPQICGERIFQKELVKEIVLFESVLTPNGPLYSVLGKVLLA